MYRDRYVCNLYAYKTYRFITPCLWKVEFRTSVIHPGMNFHGNIINNIQSRKLTKSSLRLSRSSVTKLDASPPVTTTTEK